MSSSREEAIALLSRAPLQLASTTSEGLPLGRTVHGVIAGDQLRLRDAPIEAIGRPVVVWAREAIAEIDGIVLFESAELRGVLERMDGRCAVRLDALEGRRELAQGKSASERSALLEGLWERGRAGDPRAIELVLVANPDTPRPAWLEGPATMSCAVDPAHGEAVAALLADTYWNVGIPPSDLVRAHLASTAWVGAFDGAGAIVGSARALGDGVKWATIYDVIVAPAWRGRGVGQALVRLVLDHPAVRGARKVTLRTRDAQMLYARFGFAEIRVGSAGSVEMGLLRGAAR